MAINVLKLSISHLLGSCSDSRGKMILLFAYEDQHGHCLMRPDSRRRRGVQLVTQKSRHGSPDKGGIQKQFCDFQAQAGVTFVNKISKVNSSCKLQSKNWRLGKKKVQLVAKTFEVRIRQCVKENWISKETFIVFAQQFVDEKKMLIRT